MEAILIEQFGGPEQLKKQDVTLPAVAAGQVKVALYAAGINPSDIYTASGTYAVQPRLPYTPGNDGAGVVVEIGEGVTQLAAGDRVFVAGGQAATFTGTLATHIVCDAGAVHRLPAHVTFEQGAALGIPALTAYRALVDRAQLKAGQTVLIHGASGAVGLIAVQMAKSIGATVIGTASRPEGKQLVIDAGADIVLDHVVEATVQHVLDVTNGQGPDVILEFLANVNLQTDVQLIHKRGVIVVIGNRGELVINPRTMMQKECDVRGMVLWNVTYDEYQALVNGVTNMLNTRAFTPIIGNVFSLAQAGDAFADVMHGQSNGKVIVQIQQS